MADTVSSNSVNTSLLQSLSFVSPVDTSSPSASSSTAKQPEFTNRHNLIMKHAARSHVMELMSVGSVNSWSVVVRDAEDTVLDIIGDAAVIELLKGIGVTLGVAVTDEQLTGDTGLAFDNHHAVASRKNDGRHQDKQDVSGPRVLVQEHLDTRKHLISASSPVVIMGSCNLGNISVMVQEEREIAWLNLLAKSIASAVAHRIEDDLFRRDNTLMYQALLSHLDYHVVRIGTDGNIRAYHPIPLYEAVHHALLNFTKHHPDGDCEMTIGERLYKCVLRTLSNPSGAPAGRLGLFRDITQQRQIEWRIRDADRISGLASLAAGIAHEIRNPLTTAKGFLQLFGERQIGNPERRYIDLTIRELERIQQLVTDFMSLARPESPRYQCIELNNVIGDVINFMHPEATLHGVTIVQMTEHTPLYVRADPNQLKQVLMNVLQNALQACNANGEVTVNTRCKSASALIHVRDTGAGLTREQLARAFQPFYTTKDSGTGLGLAICRQIMQEHGGSIQIASEVGVGTTVTLQLPVSPSTNQTGDD